MIDNEEELEDQILQSIIENPVLFREFVNSDDPNWRPLEQHERAWSTCTSPYIVMCCGRSVHKTTSMIEMLYWWVINNMFVVGDQGLFVLVPNKAQKDLTFFRIRQACEKHWLMRHLVDLNAINIAEGRIDFQNGFQFLIRLSGESGKESNVIGLHTYRIWVDEAQGIPWQVWLSLQNCFKKEIPGHQMFVSGVPNGMRKQNVLFECDQWDDKYICFNIAQTMMSWWSVELEYAKRKEYHAVQDDSEDYKHYVLGLHGVPTFSVFDRARFLVQDYETQIIPINQHMLDATKRPDLDGVVRIHINEAVSCPNVPTQHGVPPLIGVGWDVGFSPDPTVFMLIYYDMQLSVWRMLVRYVLERVEYPIQRDIFAYLDNIYKFNFMGIDMGGVGKVVYQELTGENNEYKDHNFIERLFPVEFGSYMVVAYNELDEEVKDQTKRVATEALSRWVHEHRLAFAKDDDDFMSELERTKFLRTATGEPVYRTDNDHQMAAIECAIMAHEHFFGGPLKSEPKVPKLLAAHWLKKPIYGVA